MASTRFRNAVMTALGTLLTVAAVTGVQFSSAAYTSVSANPGSTASAAIDWTPPRVTVQDPGIALKGAVTLTASASDGETGVRSVSFAVQSREGGAWTELCTTSTSPYRCSWDTRSVTDGSYTVRATAVDNAGYAAASTAATTVINNFGVLLTDPGDVVRGSVPLSATLLNASFGLHSVRFEYAPAGSGSWTSLCFDIFAPWTCSWSTSRVPDGLYDLRAVATQGFSTSAVSVLEGIRVDNSWLARTSTLDGATTMSATLQPQAAGVPTPSPAPVPVPAPSAPAPLTTQAPAPGDPAASAPQEHSLTETDPSDE